MRVVYDVSVLGAGLYCPPSRTGVARVVDNLRLALGAEDDVVLTCCAFHSLVNHLQVLVNSDNFSGFKNTPLSSIENPLANVAANLVAKVYPEAGSSSDNQYQWRVLNVLLNSIDSLTGGSNLGDLAGVDIFHSTYYPFPEKTSGSRSFKRFIMVHDLIPILYPQYFERGLEHLCRKIINSVRPDDWVLTNSEATKADFCNCTGIEPARVFVTPLAASDMFCQCRDKELLQSVKTKYAIPEAPYILSVCTLEPRKNVVQVIRSMIKLVREQHIEDLNLVLVGTKGWNYENIFDEITRESSMKQRVIVTGFVTDEDLPVLYSGAMMFVYPSLYEGFGLPPLEAMQCGVPVITSNTSAFPEVVGDAGIMIDPYDDDALNQAMLDIYSQSALRESLAAKSLERAKQFSWKRCAEMTVAAYKTALSS